jgi:hypothetical protein
MPEKELVEPANVQLGKNNYIGFGVSTDQFYFPNVSSCCAVIFFGPKFMVGAHMGMGWPQKGIEIDYNRVANLMLSEVFALYNERNLNTNVRPKILTIGSDGWYDNNLLNNICDHYNPITLDMFWTKLNTVDVLVYFDGKYKFRDHNGGVYKYKIIGDERNIKEKMLE